MQTDPLSHLDHRPWPLPTGPHAMRMTWDQLLFAHWPVPVTTMRSLIPAALEIDTWDGVAWIGVVPFLMRDVAPRLAPSVPWLSTFLELNVRTYVVANGVPGVFFFSLDAANPIAVKIARRWYHLPYFDAQMSMTRDGDWVAYASERTHQGAPAGRFQARYRPVGPVFYSNPGSHEAWLTERYALYAVDRSGGVHRGEVHHAQWPLQPAEAEVRVNSVAQGFGLELAGEPSILHYSEHIDVLAWQPNRV